MNEFPWWIVLASTGGACVLEAGLISLRMKKRSFARHQITKSTVWGALGSLILFLVGTTFLLPPVLFWGTDPGRQEVHPLTIVVIAFWILYSGWYIFYLRWMNTPYLRR